MTAMLGAIRLSLALLILCGGVYPAVTTLVGQVAFNRQANGSLITRADGTVVGSELIGQTFDKAGYFHSRPSAAGPDGYNAAASSGSNLGPTNKILTDRVASAAADLVAENPSLRVLPADLLTTSSSGLDPDISVAAAVAQIPRVAKARSLAEADLRALVDQKAIGPELGLFGTRRVNVLSLNLALDALKK
jgi:potassium-transporting ATPase KdpC subunit